MILWKFLFAAVLLNSAYGGNVGELAPEVEALAQEYFDWRMMDMPEFATFVGIHTYNDRLDNVTLEAAEERIAILMNFVSTIDDYSEMYTEHVDQVNLEVMRADIMTYVDGHQYKGYFFAINYSDGPHTDLLHVFDWMKRDTFEDYQVIFQRFEKVPQQIQDTIDILKMGVEEGVTSHNLSMKGVVDALNKFDVESADSPFFFLFDELSSNITEENQQIIRETATEVLNNVVAPAYGLLRDYIANEYVTRPDISVSSLPNGVELYNELIKFHTSSTKTPEEIHQMGIEEVTRIEGEMFKIVMDLGYNMTVQEFSEMIKNDPNNFYDNPEDLMDHFKDYVFNIIKPSIPQVFINVPQAELVVVADPSPDGAGAFYLAGSYDGSRPGVFYVNTYYYDAQPKYEIMTLSLHEGNPGHHLQGSHNLESPSMPAFRSVMDDRKYGVAPSRFPISTYYVEGWGLYAESTGFDMNLFDDLLERYGHYSDEIFRACRLVVDTGMHALKWSRQEAIDYMYAHTAMSLVDVENEIDRYITWPGQALAYKMGELKFQELRSKAKTELGELFDLAQFHDVILEAFGPMSVVEDEVDYWIQNTLNKVK